MNGTNIAQQIDQHQSVYDLYMKKAARKEGTAEGLSCYVKAAMEQYELSRLVGGDLAQHHRSEVIRLIRLVKTNMQEMGIEVPVPLVIDERPQPVEKTAPAASAESSAPSADKEDAGDKEAGEAGNKAKKADNFDPDQFRLKEIPQQTFDDLIDMESTIIEVREALENRMLYQKYANLSSQVDTEAPNVLLYGPPGTGKTFFFKTLANYVMSKIENSAVFILTASNLLDKYVGEAEKRLAKLFEHAEKFDFALICLDEIEALTPSRDSGEIRHQANLVTTLLQLLDGVGGKSKAMVVAASNFPWKIDEAVKSRLGRQAYLPLPSENARRQYVERHIAVKFFPKREEDAKAMIELAVKGTENGSYRELDSLRARVGRRSLDKTIKSHQDNTEISVFDPVTREELDDLLKNSHVILDEAYIRQLAEYGKQKE